MICRYLGWDDHVVSDIPGAVAAGVKAIRARARVRAIIRAWLELRLGRGLL